MWRSIKSKLTSLLDHHNDKSNNLGASVSTHSKMWDEHMQELIQFQQQHGHCQVPLDSKEYETLSDWIRQLRISYTKSLKRGDNGESDEPGPTSEVTLTKDRIADLQDLGLDLYLLGPVKTGNRRLKEILVYKRLHGHHYSIGAPNSADFPKLAEWLKNLRAADENRSKREEIPILMDVQLSQLEKVGYSINEFQPHQLTSRGGNNGDRWNRRVEELKEFKRIHGHFQVPRKGGYESLYKWKHDFESSYKTFLKGEKTKYVSVTEDRLLQLKAIGFDFNIVNDQMACNRVQKTNSSPKANLDPARPECSFEKFIADDETWNRGLQEMDEFVRKHGHFGVPSNEEKYKPLWKWLQSSRSEYTKYKSGKTSLLTRDRILQLIEEQLMLLF